MSKLPAYLMAVSAAILLVLGSIHLLYTFHGPNLLPRDADLQSRMSEISPVVSRQTTMWKTWIGFNATHSLGLILFGLVYGYLALMRPGWLFGSVFLLTVGILMLAAYAFISMRYFFNVPFGGLVLALVLYVLSAALQTVHAQGKQTPEIPEPTCVVSDQHIAAATAREKVTLETEACTASLTYIVASTLSDVKKTYATFYRQVHLTPSQADAVSLLLARRQLLTRKWSTDRLEHYEISEDAALLGEGELRMQERLTPRQMVLLKSYEETIPARYLLEPVIGRLEKEGRPMSEAQFAASSQATQQFFGEWSKARPPKVSTDKLQRCMDVHARAQQRDEHIQKILAESLDEEQLEIARAYYRDLATDRARLFRLFEEGLASGQAPLCAYPPR